MADDTVLARTFLLSLCASVSLLPWAVDRVSARRRMRRQTTCSGRKYCRSLVLLFRFRASFYPILNAVMTPLLEPAGCDWWDVTGRGGGRCRRRVRATYVQLFCRKTPGP